MSPSLDLVVDIVFQSSRYFLAAVGFWLIFVATRYYHFAHGFSISLAAYVTLTSVSQFAVPIEVGGLVAILAAGSLGLFYAKVIYAPLEARGGSGLVLLLASIAVDIVGRNMLSLFFGDARLSFRNSLPDATVFRVGSSSFSLAQALIVIAAILVAACSAIVLSKSSLGRLLRAVSDDARLAIAQGLNVSRVVTTVFVVGSVLAGLAGVLYGFDVDTTPSLGLEPLIMAAAAVVVAGRESILRLVVACVALAVAQVAVVWWVGSAWSEAIALLLLLFALIIRPGEIIRSLLDRRQLLKTVAD